MIGLGVLSWAFVIGLPVAVIYLLVGQSALRTQIAALERKLYQLTVDTNRRLSPKWLFQNLLLKMANRQKRLRRSKQVQLQVPQQ